MNDEAPKPSDHAESVRFVYEQLQGQLRIQEEQRKTFAEKAVALLAAALLFGNVVTTEMPTQAPADACLFALYVAAWILYVLAGLSLLAAALAAIYSLWPRMYRHDPTPRTLHEKYRFQNVAESQSLLSGNLVNSYESNERVLAGINRLLKVSFVCLTIGLGLLFLFALVRFALPIGQPGVTQETTQ